MKFPEVFISSSEFSWNLIYFDKVISVKSHEVSSIRIKFGEVSLITMKFSVILIKFHLFWSNLIYSAKSNRFRSAVSMKLHLIIVLSISVNFHLFLSAVSLNFHLFLLSFIYDTFPFEHTATSIPKWYILNSVRRNIPVFTRSDIYIYIYCNENVCRGHLLSNVIFWTWRTEHSDHAETFVVMKMYAIRYTSFSEIGLIPVKLHRFQ